MAEPDLKPQEMPDNRVTSSTGSSSTRLLESKPDLKQSEFWQGPDLKQSEFGQGPDLKHYEFGRDTHGPDVKHYEFGKHEPDLTASEFQHEPDPDYISDWDEWEAEWERRNPMDVPESPRAEKVLRPRTHRDVHGGKRLWWYLQEDGTYDVEYERP